MMSSSFNKLLHALGDEHSRVVQSLSSENKALKEELDGYKRSHADTKDPKMNTGVQLHTVVPARTDASVRNRKESTVTCQTGGEDAHHLDHNQFDTVIPASTAPASVKNCKEAIVEFQDSATGREDTHHPDHNQGDDGHSACSNRRVSKPLEFRSMYGKMRSEMESKAQEIEDALQIGENAEFSQRNAVTTSQGLFGKLESLLLSPLFDWTVCGLIFLNLVIMVIETQYLGIQIGYAVQYPGFAQRDPESWGPSAGDILLSIERTFIVLFACELILRIIVFRTRYLASVLNWLDIVVVFSGLADWIFEQVWECPNCAIFRVLRLLKLGRGMRLLRVIRVLDSLHLILRCVSSSLVTLLWTFGLLALVQCVAAMVFSSLLQSYLQSESNPREKRHLVFAYYGTFTRSLLTMFEVMLANWAPACRVLVDNVNEVYSLAFLLYRCCLGFAILNIITAVFIQQTLKSAQTCDDVRIVQKQRAQEEYANKLKKLFHRLDTSGDGLVSWEEFQELMTNKHMRTWLSLLDIQVNDLESFFRTMDDGDGQITVDELVMGVSRLKGQANAIDIAHVTAMVKRLDGKIDTVFRTPVKNNNVAKLPFPTQVSAQHDESKELTNRRNAEAVREDNDVQLPNCIS